MIDMIKLLFLLLLSFNGFSQNHKSPEYIPVGTQKVYDIEIIVFAYDTPLPNAQTYGNKPVFDASLAFELDFKPDDMLPTKKAKVQDDNGQYTIDIDGKDDSILVLAWFEHDASKFQLTSVWDKLQNNQKTIPLIHRAWRQPETKFETPEFIKISSILETENTDKDNNNATYPNNTILGQVALSKGRYLHFSNQLNLIRTQNSLNEESDDFRDFVFSITEREQVKSGEFHYFDNPWFGVLVKITQYTGEEADE